MPQAPHNFTFIHAADLHLDTPFHGIHEVAPEIAMALREASLNAFEAIIDLAVERRVAFVVIAGDIYDGAERGLRAQLRFRAGLARLSDAGIASFVVHGNHDPLQGGWSAIATWPERATIFGSDRVETVPIVIDGETVATVQGISYATSATTENLSLGFKRPSAPGLHVGLLHCNVAGVADGYANYSPCTVEQLRSIGLDYLALGHIHQRRVLSGRPGGTEPHIVYSGNTQARSPKATEREPKGVVVVHVQDNVIEELEFVACDSIRFVEISCPLEEVSDLAELEDRLLEAGREQLAKNNGRSIIVRARLSGHSELHTDLRRAGIIEDLLLRLRELSAHGQPFCWWDELIDESMIALDLDELRDRGDFGSDLLALARDFASDDLGRRQVAQALLEGVPRSLRSNLESLLSDDTRLGALLEQATMLAIDELLVDRS